MNNSLIYENAHEYWTFEDGLAVWNDTQRQRQAKYTYETICFAIDNVKRNRKNYSNDNLFIAAISHFEQGRSLFPINHLMTDKGVNKI